MLRWVLRFSRFPDSGDFGGAYSGDVLDIGLGIRIAGEDTTAVFGVLCEKMSMS